MGVRVKEKAAVLVWLCHNVTHAISKTKRGVGIVIINDSIVFGGNIITYLYEFYGWKITAEIPVCTRDTAVWVRG